MQRGSETVLRHRRFDVDEYRRLAEAGILHEDDRVELIEGEIVQMSAVGTRHAACVRFLTRICVRAVSDPVCVSVQNPVRLGPYSEPEPDVTVLRPRADGYSTAHPGPDDVQLLIEIADSSLPYDRSVKLPLYAKAGIGEVWIVDLTTAALEVYREPHDGRYKRRRRLVDGNVAPLAFDDVEIAVRELLPPTD